MTNRTRHTTPTLFVVPTRSAEQEEVSRVVRLSPILPMLEQAPKERFMVGFEAWAAFAIVVLASSATVHAAAWLLERWQLR